MKKDIINFDDYSEEIIEQLVEELTKYIAGNIRFRLKDHTRKSLYECIEKNPVMELSEEINFNYSFKFNVISIQAMIGKILNENESKYKNKKMLMNPKTGTVQEEMKWYDDWSNSFVELWGGYNFEDAGLVEVEQDENGNWIEK